MDWHELGAADFQMMAPAGLPAEVMIERDDSMHFGARNIERFSQLRNSGLRHASKLLLQRMKDRQGRSLEPEMG